MKTREEIISDEKINLAWGNADFGNISKRDVIIEGLKNTSCGNGSAIILSDILTSLKLIWINNGATGLTKKGLQYLLAATKAKEIEDWSKPVDGIIHVPDELDKLVNTFGHHYNVMAVSGIIGQQEMICRMVYAAQKFFNK